MKPPATCAMQEILVMALAHSQNGDIIKALFRLYDDEAH
jgi:hypothetical protein